MSWSSIRRALGVGIACIALASSGSFGARFVTADPAPAKPRTVRPVAAVDVVEAVPVRTLAALATRPYDDTLRAGAAGKTVRSLEERLRDLGYWVGRVDGRYDGNTAQAVMAFQKVNGLGRDGVVGPKTRAALKTAKRPKPRATTGTVLEVDKARQVMYVVRDGRLQWVFNVSTGSGSWYVGSDGTLQRAITPLGRYAVQRQIDAWRKSKLGMLYRPKYFIGGYAVHGAYSVPGWPASHGCIRVSIAAMDWIWSTGAAPIGSSIWIY